MTSRLRATVALAAFLLAPVRESPDSSQSAPVFDGKAPADLLELRHLEQLVQEVFEKVTPATVALLVSGGSQGSGVVVSEAGLILTAGHVIGSRPGRSVSVIFPDGRKARGVTLRADLDRDTGMIQLKEEGPWPHVPMAVRELISGEWCVALGHPGGYEVDRPPIPRLGRVLRGGDRSFVRTDCPIIRGDSGGPLFDLDGRLIGIHSRLEARLTANYHVPIRWFLDDWDRLAGGKDAPDRELNARDG